jgi:hypothetical protein
VGLNNAQVTQEYEQTLGVDETSNEASIPAGYVRSAWNANLGLSGGYEKRDGHSEQLSAEWTGLSITAGIEYRTPAITARKVLFGTDGTASGGEIGYDNAGAMTSVLSGLAGTVRPTFVQLNRLLGFFNGEDAPVIYDGAATRQMGITAPAAAPSLVAGTAGSLANGSYVFAYTYYNSATGAESSPSALATIVLGGANDSVDLTLLAGDSDTADTIRIYRTTANGNELFLDGTNNIADTTYTSIVEDAGLSSIGLEYDNSRITDFVPTLNSIQAQYPSVAQNRVFLKTDRNTIRHSKIGQSGPMFESFEASAVAYCKGKYGDRDDVIGSGVAGDVPIVLKERSVGRLDAIGVNPELSPFDQVRYNYIEISASVGAVSHWAGCQVYDEYVFLGRDNVYATNGQGIRKVGDRVAAFIQSCGFLSSQVTKISAENDVRNQRIIISIFKDAVSTVPDYQLVGDYRKYPDFRWTFYRPGVNASTHPGIRPGCFFLAQNAVDGGFDLYAGNLDANGQYYKLNDGADDLTYGIYFRVKTRAYDKGAPMADKLYKDAGFHVRGNGEAYSMSVSAIYDLAGFEEGAENISLATGGAQWDVAVWDVDSWSDDAILLSQYSAHRKAKFQQLVFSNTGADQPIEILGWATSAAQYGLY